MHDTQLCEPKSGSKILRGPKRLFNRRGPIRQSHPEPISDQPPVRARESWITQRWTRDVLEPWRSRLERTDNQDAPCTSRSTSQGVQTHQFMDENRLDRVRSENLAIPCTSGGTNQGVPIHQFMDENRFDRVRSENLAIPCTSGGTNQGVPIHQFMDENRFDRVR
ncbi:unnamed protein product [Nezara viridula]|nr:unnamed protein product [Nezara viridula]